MMDTIPCPGCRTPLNLSDTGCPICLRGRSKYEIARGYARLREDTTRRRRRPFIVLGALAVAAAAGRLAYLQRERIAQAYGSARARAARFVDEAGDPAHYAERRPAEVAAPPQEPQPSDPPPRARAEPGRVDAPAPVAAAPKNIPDLVAPPMSPGMWAARGRVYDLKTLRPAAGAMIEFIHSAGGRHGGTSDEYGRYLIVLPRSNPPGGYEAVCRDARYHEHVFHETDIPYAGLSSADRELLVDSARGGDARSTPLADIDGEESRRLDLFLAPRR